MLLLRFPDRVLERLVSIRLRNALLTASSFGKALATCGSSTITFVDSRIRFAYLPRTNSPKSARLYFGRPQSFSSDLAIIRKIALRRPIIRLCPDPMQFIITAPSNNQAYDGGA